MATQSQKLPSGYEPPPKVIKPGHDLGTISDRLSAFVLRKRTPQWWLVGLSISFIFFMGFMLAAGYLLYWGVGVWGVNNPVGWGFAIVNLVWWIGIGHAGTLISAILLLFRQKWRTSISRFAEAMTLFAVACAGLFPILHTGRPWLAYWLLPYPNTMQMWPQFRSPLVWDVFAISTYGTVSLLFWYVGLIPDLGTLRDRTKKRFFQVIYGFLSLGWRGSAKHWQNYEMAYLLLAGLATPLVLSVHTVVSFDFAVSLIPGWHTTIFPPYFVAGAIYSGFAMVLTLAIPVRWFCKMEDFITMRHLHNMGKVMLATGLIVAYGYMMEAFMAWYSAAQYEVDMMRYRVFDGPYAHVYTMLILFNILIPQLLWSSKIRANVVMLWILSIVVNVGMWLERYVIVVTSLARDYMPSAWDTYGGTVWDYMLYFGTIGLFVTLVFLFIRVLPFISMSEIRHMWREQKHQGEA
ncbi:MAG TPA: NrfD/PsrC family molybdoenzyme membrane anchor subunit [Acidobacteriota bacterium]|nr:NrfD/PsrC family molybdoenzyme membrane anchor subunit [Acidobacteriota bacterium]